jgi:hypothetical protein
MDTAPYETGDNYVSYLHPQREGLRVYLVDLVEVAEDKRVGVFGQAQLQPATMLKYIAVDITILRTTLVVVKAERDALPAPAASLLRSHK